MTSCLTLTSSDPPVPESSALSSVTESGVDRLQINEYKEKKKTGFIINWPLGGSLSRDPYNEKNKEINGT
jgi:hypothetical protein